MTAVPEVIAAPVPAEARPDLLRRPRATSGVWSWFTTIDHKKIGILYIVTAGVFFFLGGVEALLIRLQLSVANNSLITPDAYNQLFTMH
ncbi:MAG: cbb3-type cytochrome c oxidase subunit I, partial [Actinomycetes bacterium]